MYVFLGRFSPFHNGHKKIVDYMITNFGAKNCLIMVGSSNVINDRTPFPHKERLKMIRSVFPHLKILPLPDVSDDHVWLDNISEISKKLNTQFIFVGGSKQDLQILSTRFQTKVIFDRKNEGYGISATLIRQFMKEKNTKKLKSLLPPSVCKLVLKY